MTFLNSIFLSALAAVAIPLLIHFLSRRRIKIVDFSSLKFLFQMQKSKLRWLKILELLLLLIRMMILALIALAFARPTLTGQSSSTHAPASIVILLDNSFSVERLSSGGIVFDDMKRGITDIIDLLNAGDDATIISLAGKQTQIGPYSDFNSLKQALASIHPKPGYPNIAEGLSSANRLLESSHNLNKEIYLISDLQRGPAWEDFANIIDDRFSYFAVKYSNTDVENVGIVRSVFPPQLLTPSEEFAISAIMHNYDNSAANDRLVELFVDGQKIAQTIVNIKPGADELVEFSVIPDKPGQHYGYFEIEDDDYSIDNRLYFNFDIPEKISVMAVGDAIKDLTLFRNSFEKTDLDYIDFTGVRVAEFARQDISGYDVIILNSMKSLTPNMQNSLKDFINSGGGLFVIIGENANLESYSGFIKANSTITKISDRKAATDSYFYLENFDLLHPIFKIYSSQNPEAPEIPIIKLSNFVSFNGGHQLASLEDNSVVLTSSGNNQMIVSGFGFDRSSSDISVHSFIIPFLIRTVEFLSSSRSTAEDYFISGQPALINLKEKQVSTSVTISGLKNYKYSESSFDEIIEVSHSVSGPFISIGRTDRPGFYFLTDNRDTLGMFSVNHDSTESISGSYNPDELSDMFGKNIVMFNGYSDISQEIIQAKFGYELWKYCLLAALILLIAESIIIRRTK